MDKFKIIIDNGVETEVDGIFYLYNSKYYFAYTKKELDDKGYVVFHLVQVGKEIQNTPSGPLDTGYMIGMEISDVEEWKNVQGSITKIVNDKKNGTQDPEIQYLPQNMLSVLKVVSSKTFRLAKNVVEETFKLVVDPTSQNVLVDIASPTEVINNSLNNILVPQEIATPVSVEPVNPSPLEVSNDTSQGNIFGTPTPLSEINKTSSSNEPVVVANDSIFSSEYVSQNNEGQNTVNNVLPVSETSTDVSQNDVIIDYRAKFFEEQEKNQQLEQQLKELTAKLENIKQLIG